jgi:hypothetical protein
MENACLYKVFLISDCNKVSSPSLLLSTRILSSHSTNSLLQNEILYFIYRRGLFELFPPTNLPYSITLNGLSSPASGSRYHPYKHLKPIYSMPAQRHDSMAQQPKH